MAKDNFILHNASGKVGNLVTYKREGKQVTREWVAEVKNPRSQLQSQQRNFLAPVSKFYAPFAIALEQSFEGLSKAKSHNAFQKANIELARREGFYLPKGTGFFPAPYKVSQGTLVPINVYKIDDTNSEICFGVKSNVDDNMGGLSQMFINNFDAKNGDQVTIIAINLTQGSFEDVSLESDFVPSYRRFLLDSTSTDRLTTENGIALESIQEGNETTFQITNAIGRGDLVAAAVILSRWENGKWRRSTQYMYCVPELLKLITGTDAASTAIRSYMNDNYSKQSDVYLNGSTGNNTGGSIDTSYNLPYVTYTAGGLQVTITNVTTRNYEIDGDTREFIVGVDNNGVVHPFLYNTNANLNKAAMYYDQGLLSDGIIANPGNAYLLTSSNPALANESGFQRAPWDNYQLLRNHFTPAAAYVAENEYLG